MLSTHSAQAVLLTLGSMGSLYVSPTETVDVSCHPATAVDTSGAGDCFIGAVAFYKARHPELGWQQLLTLASEVAALSVTKTGTQSSYPSRDELPSHLLP